MTYSKNSSISWDSILKVKEDSIDLSLRGETFKATVVEETFKVGSQKKDMRVNFVGIVFYPGYIYRCIYFSFSIFKYILFFWTNIGYKV